MEGEEKRRPKENTIFGGGWRTEKPGSRKLGGMRICGDYIHALFGKNHAHRYWNFKLNQDCAF